MRIFVFIQSPSLSVSQQNVTSFMSKRTFRQTHRRSCYNGGGWRTSLRAPPMFRENSRNVSKLCFTRPNRRPHVGIRDVRESCHAFCTESFLSVSIEINGIRTLPRISDGHRYSFKTEFVQGHENYVDVSERTSTFLFFHL